MTNIIDPSVVLTQNAVGSDEDKGLRNQNKRKREETEIYREVRRHALKLCSVEQDDAVALFSIFMEAGLVDCHSLADMLDHSDIFATNEENRITELSLGRQRSTLSPWEFHTEGIFDLLESLEKLETLKLSNCASFQLPETLARFPNLKVLEVSSCETIILRRSPTQQTHSMDKSLIIVPPNLEKFRLPDYHMDTQEELAEFLFEVLPTVPNLTEFKIASNKIRSFQGIAKQIRDNNERTSSRLRLLNLGQCKCDTAHDHWLIMQSQLERKRLVPGNYEFLDLREQDLEVEAMQTFLRAYRELQTVIRDAHMDRFFGWKPRASITYLMEINYAGRVLVEGNGSSSSNADDPKADESSPIIRNTVPLSAWPLVLERAWKWNHPSRFYCHGKTDGIYYLLQNVEALRAASHRKKKTNANTSAL